MSMSPLRELGVDPVIYLSPSPDLFRACADAFGGLPFCVVVEGAQWGSSPDNFIPSPEVPRADLLQRATLAIHSADPDLVEECARAGVPQLIYPPNEKTVRLAARVEQVGAGLRLGETDINGPRLRQLAGRVMADPRYTRGAMRLGEFLRTQDGSLT